MISVDGSRYIELIYQIYFMISIQYIFYLATINPTIQSELKFFPIFWNAHNFLRLLRGSLYTALYYTFNISSKEDAFALVRSSDLYIYWKPAVQSIGRWFILSNLHTRTLPHMTVKNKSNVICACSAHFVLQSFKKKKKRTCVCGLRGLLSSLWHRNHCWALFILR